MKPTLRRTYAKQHCFETNIENAVDKPTLFEADVENELDNKPHLLDADTEKDLCQTALF